MAKEMKRVLGRENKTKGWRVGLIVAATVLLAAAVGAGVLGQPASSPPGLRDATPPGKVLMAVDTFVTVTPQQGRGNAFAFEIKDFAFGVENPTTIGSATGGAGAGKIKFNEFQIKKTTDTASPVFFKSCAAGEHFQEITIVQKKASAKEGGSAATNGTPFLKFRFETVFTTKIDWTGPGDEGPEESITFVYGKLSVTYFDQDPATGQMRETFFGWDQVTNKAISPEE